MNFTQKISVIVPVYNTEKYISKCVESIINQTYKNLEIIIINDGSIDSSYDICRSYAEQDNRIVLINQSNQGIAATRNIGIYKSTCEYFVFIDSDDFAEKDMIECLYNAIAQTKSDIAICNVDFIDESGVSITDKTGKDVLRFNNYYGDDNLILEKHDEKISYFLKYDNTFVYNKLYKTSLFDDIKFPSNKIYEDYFIMHKIIDKSEKIIVIPKYKYYYVRHKGSLTNQQFSLEQLDMIEGRIERHNYIVKKYFYFEKITRTQIFSGLLNCMYKIAMDNGNKVDLYHEALINNINKVKRYNVDDTYLTEGQKNLLKILFYDINKYINIVCFYSQN